MKWLTQTQVLKLLEKIVENDDIGTEPKAHPTDYLLIAKEKHILQWGALALSQPKDQPWHSVLTDGMQYEIHSINHEALLPKKV